MSFKKFGTGEVIGQQDARHNDRTVRELASNEKAKKAEFERIYGAPEGEPEGDEQS